MKKRIKTSLLFLFGVLSTSFALSALAGEFIVRHINPQPTYDQSRKEGLTIFQPSAFVPFTVKPNLNTTHLGYTREFNHRVATNNGGFRGSNAVEAEKPDGTYRILVVGDSMTFGWGVEDDETFSSVLERNLNSVAKEMNTPTRFEVLNAGFRGGFTVDGFYSYLINEGFMYHPDLVLVSFFPYNDISDLLEMKWNQVDQFGFPIAVQSMDTTVKEGRLAKRRPTEWKYVIPGLRNSHLVFLLESALEKYSPKTVDRIKRVLRVAPETPRADRSDIDRCLYDSLCHEDLQTMKDQAMKLIVEMSHRSKENQAAFISLIIPSPDQVKPFAGLTKGEKANRLTNAKPQTELKDYWKGANIETIDVLPSLTDSPAEKYFYGRDGHFNPRGHGRVAQEIFEQLAVKKGTSDMQLASERYQELREEGILRF